MNIISVVLFVCREAKMHCNPKDLADFVHDFGGVISVRCNAAGNRVSILTKKVRVIFTVILNIFI